MYFMAFLLLSPKSSFASGASRLLSKKPKFLRSSFFVLFNRRLVPSYNLGFAELCAPLPAQSQPSVRFADSLLERETGFEPATSYLASRHSTTELLPHFIPK